MRINRFTKSNRCPICSGYDNQERGKGRRCHGFLSDDKNWAHCSRDERAGTLIKNSNSNTYAHKLSGDCKCGVRHDPSIPEPNNSPITYDYTDENGKLLYQVCRLASPKRFFQRRPDGSGGWINNLQGVRRVLYGLPELIAADASETVFIVEGEKDADSLSSLGLLATTNSCGAGKWRDNYNEFLRARNVIILPDNDDEGQGHANQITASLKHIAASVRIVTLPDLPVKGDVSDWLKAGGSIQDLKEIVEHACAFSSFDAIPDASTSIATKSLQIDAQKQSDDENKSSKLIKKDELIRLAVETEMFCEPNGNGDKVYATIKVDNHFETYKINSNEFRLWLTNEFYKAHGQAVSRQPMQDALSTLAAKAYFEGKKHRVFIRIGELNGKLYYDLGDESWRVVEIDEEGWRVLDKSPVKFVRPFGYNSQVVPISGGNLNELRQFVNVRSDDDWVLFVSWLISSFRASGPYALLSLAGTQDAAKSTTTKMLRLLIDPNEALVRAQPKEERDLMVSAKNNWLLAFDNLSYISEWLSDALCRVSTGGGQSTRQQYTDGDEYIFNVTRPVVMNGIEELATRPDLADRTINVFLPSLDDSQRKDEKVLYEEFQKSLPRILGAIFDVLSAAIKNLPNTHLDNLPRMADVAKFVSAGEAALGWPRGQFMKAYDAYRRAARINAVEASHLGTAILSLTSRHSHWEGTASELLEFFDAEVPKMSKKNLPSSARGIAGALRRLVPNLKEIGIEVELPERAQRSLGGKVQRLIKVTKCDWKGPSEPLFRETGDVTM